MISFRSCTHTLAALVSLIVISAAPASAQVDVTSMDTWTSVTIVHYRIVGEYSGEPLFFRGAEGWSRTAKVTDRLEIEFDWNQNEMTLVGKPVIRNFPTKAAVIAVPGCPQPRIEGSFEFLIALSMQNSGPGPVLTLDVKQDYPGGAIPYPSERGTDCGAGWDKVTAKSEASTMDLIVIPAYALAMPGSGAANATISPDGKSLILSKDTGGWVWTYTPTPVK